MLRYAYAPVHLHFKEPAGTSRGTLTTKLTYLIKVWDEGNPGCVGIGEAPLFQGLSAEDAPDYEERLAAFLAHDPNQTDGLNRFSSIKLGVESAVHDLVNGGRGVYFPSKFTEGKSAIPTNGLVWMGDFPTMIERIDSKVAQGYTCIKLKIGAIEFEHEVEMLAHIRRKYPQRRLTIRLDANGGFTPADALEKLRRLAPYEVHSIEQPVKPQYRRELAELARLSPIAVALDESLIGIYTPQERRALLAEVRPQYIVLKPALCGGFSGALEWMEAAREAGAGFWITSALESNVGLSALAQFAGALGLTAPQGLGTGALFTANFTSPLRLTPPDMHFDPALLPVGREQFAALEWREP